jgi:flagellar motor switch protein FliM
VTEPVLEQEQIDQLIEAIDEGKIPAGPHALLSVRKAVPLDLSDPTWSQDRVIRRRLPVLDLVAERFAPAVQVTLTKSLRSPVRAEGISVELQKFGEFRRRLEGRRCLFEVMRLDPLPGSSILVMAPTMTYALIDALMGGLGIAEIPEDREIETSVISAPSASRATSCPSPRSISFFPIRTSSRFSRPPPHALEKR